MSPLFIESLPCFILSAFGRLPLHPCPPEAVLVAVVARVPGEAQVLVARGELSCGICTTGPQTEHSLSLREELGL